MKAKFSLFVFVLTFISVFFAATAMAQPALTTLSPTTALGAGETFAGLQAAMRCAPGTFIMEKGNLLLMAWPKGGEYAFAIIGKNGATASELNALKVNTESLSMMVKSLEQGGWKNILPAAVPAAVSQALGMLTVEMAMTAMRSLPTIFVVPVAMFEYDATVVN